MVCKEDARRIGIYPTETIKSCLHTFDQKSVYLGHFNVSSIGLKSVLRDRTTIPRENISFEYLRFAEIEKGDRPTNATSSSSSSSSPTINFSSVPFFFSNERLQSGNKTTESSRSESIARGHREERNRKGWNSS